MTIPWKPMDQAPKNRPIAIVAVTMEHEVVPNEPFAGVVVRDRIGGGAHVSIDVCQWRDDCFELGWGMRTNVGHGNARAWCEVYELNLRELLPAHALQRVV